MNIIPYNIECRANFYYYYDSAVTECRRQKIWKV